MPVVTIRSSILTHDGLIATLLSDGHITVPGAPASPVAGVGYNTPPPGPRLLAALLAAGGG